MRQAPVLFLLLLVCEAASSQPRETTSSPGQTTLAFISDTQTPLFVESIVLPGWGNQQVTRRLFSDLRQRHPSHVFILGDLVSLGFHQSSWEAVDRYVAGMRSDGIPVDAILGNHELMLYGREGEDNFDSLFPEHARTGYARTVDSVAILLLNSNLGSLSAEDRLKQQRWYEAVLDSFQASPAIRSVIVCCHHSPFSNSLIVGSSEEARNEFVPRFLSTPKCLLFLSGHAHAFEHFVWGGKNFLVIGGGGGPRHPLRERPEWTDVAFEVKPLFHYISVGRKGGGLDVHVHGIVAGTETIGDVYEVRIPESK